jgi:hypothetical protein
LKARYFSGGVLAAGILIGAVMTGCGLVSAGKPVAAIVSPPSGTQVDTNSEVQVQVNASDSDAIVRIDLMVNGAVVSSQATPTGAGQPTFNAILRWTPSTAGQQVVQVLAYNRKGDVSAPVAVNILVRDAVAATTSTPAAVAAATSTPAATAVAATAVASATPTASVPVSALPTSTSAPATALPPITIVVLPPPPQQPTQPAAPAKPSDFKADGQGTTITFTWDDKATNEQGFRIYQVGQVAPVIELPAHSATGGMTYAWSGRPCNFSASFYIRAYNNDGESSSSNSDGAVTVPCVPTGLSAIGGTNAIQFDFAVATVHNEAGFRIYEQGVTAPVASRGPNLGSGGTVFGVTLPCNLLATFSVRAFNSAGESANSNLVQNETAPCGPTNFHITGVSKTTVNYSWTDNGTNETGFHVYRDDVLYVLLPAHSGTGTVSNDAFQNCGQTLVYSVRAFNLSGESNTSEHVGATTLPFLNGCP